MFVDDSMAILMAFQTQEVEIIGLTTIFGNVMIEDASRNALLLVCGCVLTSVLVSSLIILRNPRRYLISLIFMSTHLF